MKSLAVLALIIIVAIAVQLVSKNAKKSSKSSAIYRYGRKDFFMNRAEHEFFNVLIGAVGNDYYVFPQVHLSTILEHRIKGQDWRAAFRRINGKSVDFVICDKAYIKLMAENIIVLSLSLPISMLIFVKHYHTTNKKNLFRDAIPNFV